MNRRAPTELIDLVDTRGRMVRRAVARDDADRYGGLLMQIVIAVVVNSRGEVLVQQRAATKPVEPGHIDHVCGGIRSGETPDEAAAREAHEEVGVRLAEARVVRHGVNPYQRYRYLLRAYSEDRPVLAPQKSEVTWARFYTPATLRAKARAGQMAFVAGFFDDLEEALK